MIPATKNDHIGKGGRFIRGTVSCLAAFVKTLGYSRDRQVDALVQSLAQILQGIPRMDQEPV